jgi:hypothetical protein
VLRLRMSGVVHPFPTGRQSRRREKKRKTTIKMDG